MEPKSMPDLNARELQKNELMPRLMILRVAVDSWGLPEFEAGQTEFRCV